MERFAKAINKAMNNNTVINVFLVGCFAAMAARSAKQQKQIEALEAENDTLDKSNKTIKNTIWKSKQDLYAAAATPEAENSTFVPPLSTLKVIYGDAIAAPSSAFSSSMDADNQGNVKSSPSRIII